MAITNQDALTMKERLAALRNLPAFFKLVWESSQKMTIINSVLRVVRSVLPLAMLYVGKLIIDQVVMLSRSNGNHSMNHLWALVAIEFGLAVLSDSLNRAIMLMDGLLGDLFSNHTSIKIMTHAAILDLDQFEDSVFYDKLERARKQTVDRTILLSQVMTQIQEIITMGFLAVGLIAFNPWLILLLLIAVLPAFLGESYFNDKNYALTRGQTPERRELDYIRYLGASDETAKEVKIFDLSGFIIDRFRKLSNKFYADNRRLSIRRSVWGTVFALLGTTGYYAAYTVIIIQTVKGTVSIGQLTFLAGSFRQMRSLLESILTRFASVSQSAMYLRDFFDFFEIKPKITIPSNPRKFPHTIHTGFTFEDVGFKYVNSDHWANRHLNFTLHPGEKLALVGENCSRGCMTLQKAVFYLMGLI